MVMWQLMLIIGFAFLILEMFTPVMFFLNFVVAAFITSLISIFIIDINTLMIVFIAISLLLLFFVRPLFIKKRTKEQTTGMDNKYIGKTAKVIETITSTSGVISIYDERWEARCEDGKKIPVGESVKIIKYDSLIMSVKEED